ncbi:Phytoene synthase, chloroplastic [Glycine max]|nr:Phytoene synthase, chloroplastic [Glycine max]
MIQGMRMDTRKARYNNFQELYLYCYNVAGTVGLMTVPIMGIAEESVIPVQSVYDAALYLEVECTFPKTNKPSLGYVTKMFFQERWRKIMKYHITRARFYFNRVEEGVSQLQKASCWPVRTYLLYF